MSPQPEEPSELEKIQSTVFTASAHRSSESLPNDLQLHAVPNAQAKEDVQALLDAGKLTWNFNLKVMPFMATVSNLEHLVQCVAYYGCDDGKHHQCLGYAIGCINENIGAVEIAYIEKRKDSPEALRSKFLNIIVDAYSSYALYLNKLIPEVNINKFVFVNPVEDKISFYRSRGYTITEQYGDGFRAAIKDLQQ